MKKAFSIIIALVLIATFTLPVLAEVVSNDGANSDTPENFTEEQQDSELQSEDILNDFQEGMSIEEFLIRNQGPIPYALQEFADMSVTIIVQLEKPSLIEYINQEGFGREDGIGDQEAYVAELENDQNAILNEIVAGRASDVQQIGESFTMALNGFMLKVPANLVNEIRAISGVKTVTKAAEYEIDLWTSTPLIGADAVQADLGYTGAGVTIAVIDTGIDYTHQMLGGSGDPADYTSNNPDSIESGTFPNLKVIGGYDFAGTNYDASDNENNIPVPDDDPLDENGHGTHVASIAAGLAMDFGSGVAPGASLYALKIFGASGSTHLTLQAIEWAMDPNGLGNLSDPVDVINMSFSANWGPADENNPEFQAVENATSIGVVVVASAGNSGDSSYVVGSPSTVDSAISVAASTTGYYKAPFIVIDNETYIPYCPSTHPLTETITAELMNVSTWVDSYGLCNIPEGVEGILTGKIALITPRTCHVDKQVNNAAALGAVAAVYSTYYSIPSPITLEGLAIPTVSIKQTDGWTLRTADREIISLGPDLLMTTFEEDEPADSIAEFSSRGPRGFDSKLKPEITAPGEEIYAAAMGTGIWGFNYSGSSMAAPHLAGVAALMVEAHPDWLPAHIKAAMMNTAVDLVGDASGVIPSQGAGRVDAVNATLAEYAIYADPKLISLSWGLIEITDDYSDTQTITIKNFSGESVNFNVSTQFTSISDGATLTPSETNVSAPAEGTTSIEVTLTLDADQLSQTVGEMEEYYGFVNFDNGEVIFRVPFYFVPHIYTEISELNVNTEYDMNTWLLELEQNGPLASSLEAYSVSLVSDNDPAVLDAADIQFVGMDYGWYGWEGRTDYIRMAFVMWGGVHTNQPYFNEIDLYTYPPETSYVTFNYNYGRFLGEYEDNYWILVRYNFETGWLSHIGEFMADYNSGIQRWELFPGYYGISDEFYYQVVSWDYYGNEDYVGISRYDIDNLPLSTVISDPNPENIDFEVTVGLNDFSSYIKNDTQGFLLVDFYGKAGTGQAYYWPLSFFDDLFLPLVVE